MTNVFGGDDNTLTGKLKKVVGATVDAAVDATISVAARTPAGKEAEAACQQVVTQAEAWDPDAGAATHLVAPGVVLYLYRYNGNGTPMAEVSGAGKLLTAHLVKHYQSMRAGGVAHTQNGKVTIQLAK